MTDTEKQEIIDAVISQLLSNGLDITGLNAVESLEGISTFPAVLTTTTDGVTTKAIVSVPISLLTQAVQDVIDDAVDATTDAQSAAAGWAAAAHKTKGDITIINGNITNLQDADKSISSLTAYAECSTAANVSAKSVTVPYFSLPTSGGCLHVKMANANTAVSGVTLNINATGAKDLYYNGSAVSATNTWEDNEILEIYYDGTNYQATNAQGGGGSADRISFDNSQSGLTSTNVQGAIEGVNGKLYEMTEIETTIDQFTKIDEKGIVSGDGATSGNMISSSYYNLYYFAVTEGDTLRVNVKTASSVISSAYAFYGTSEPSNFNHNNLIGNVGPTLGYDDGDGNGEFTQTLVVPNGAVVFAFVEYVTTGSLHTETTIKKIEYEKTLKTDVIEDEIEDLQEGVGDIEDYISEMQETLSSLQTDVDKNTEICNSLYTEVVDREITSSDCDTLSASYIKIDGYIRELNSEQVDYFSVTPGERYRISVKNGVGGAAIYAFYDAANLDEYGVSEGNAHVVGDVGPQLQSNNGENTILLTVPTGAVILATTMYNAGSMTRSIEKMKTELVIDGMQDDIDQLKEDINSVNGEGKSYCVEYDNNGNIFVAYLANNGIETVYWFKKCMANELFTFYKVGYRQVSTRSIPDTNGISSDASIINIVTTQSDNIGPIWLRYGEASAEHFWVGGNHLYPDNNTSSNPKTARTDTFVCFVDGKQVSAGTKVFGNDVLVKVSNSLLNPLNSYSVICTETVVYSIVKNSIAVSLMETFGNTSMSIDAYYGMQSVFSGDEYLTPNGEKNSWTNGAISATFNKSNYPSFNRFIERKKENTVPNRYMSAYLLNNKLGTHELTTNMFTKSGGKCYHILIQNKTNIANSSFVWNGVYSFFDTAILDDENAFVYSGVINGKDAIFINTFKACNINITLPNDYLMRKINIVEQSSGITTSDSFTDVQGISINATGIGSMIFTLD